MSYDYSLYWKTYADFKKNNYEFSETAVVRRKTATGTTYYMQGELDIYWDIDTLQWAEDPFKATLGTTTSYVNFQMAYVDFLLAFNLIPISTGINCNITNDGTGKQLATTGVAHNLTNDDTIRFNSILSPWTFYGVEVLSPTTFRPLNLPDKTPVTYTANRSDSFYKNLLGYRITPFSAKNAYDFNNYITQPNSISDLYTARTVANLYLPSSGRYLTLFDFKFDSLKCIVSVRGEFRTTPNIYT